MVIDIVKFFFIYTLVLFAFACGLNQLLWYFAELERQKCYSGMSDPSWDAGDDACLRWRRWIIKSLDEMRDVSVSFILSYILPDLNDHEKNSRSCILFQIGNIKYEIGNNKYKYW